MLERVKQFIKFYFDGHIHYSLNLVLSRPAIHKQNRVKRLCDLSANKYRNYFTYIIVLYKGKLNYLRLNYAKKNKKNIYK